jgi:carboxyl-terminal processing protease
VTRRLATALVVLFLVAFAGGACARTSSLPGAPAGRAIAVDPLLSLQTFDSAWSRIATTHYDTAFGGVDWHGVRVELRPLAAAATTLGDLRRVIDEMLRRLGESHFVLIPRDVADALDEGRGPEPAVSGDAGLQVRLVDDSFIAWRVDDDGPAAAAGVAPGWTLLAVDGRELAPPITALRARPEAERRTALTRLLYQANAALTGESGQSVQLRLADSGDGVVDLAVVLRPTRGDLVRFANLPPVIGLLHDERITTGADCIGLIRLNIWLVPLAAAFDRAVDTMRGCAGIIIDLRGNPGGVAGMIMGTSGHFLNDTLALGFMQTRTSELRFKANPRRVRADGTAVTPYAGPLAILVDEMSASTSEFFAAGLQGVGRARVFGAPTAGQALPALMVRLPTNDVLMHVIADFTGPGGVRIEGRGVIPDVAAASTRSDLLAGRDVPLLAALDWIAAAAGTGTSQTGESR